MSPDQERRLEELFSAARDLPALERTAFLERVCEGDAELRRQADSLLAAHEQAGQFLQPTIALSAPRALAGKSGDRIGRYKLLEQIGEGGFGVVWMAEQEEPVRRRVALKIIKLGMDTKEVLARFEAERQALAMMDHPNIARVFDGGATDTGRPYFVMELVKGVPITEYCDANKLSTRERLELFMQVCHAVQHAHQKGVIHRDLKPSNVLVTVQDDRPAPKVIDFGVAKATQARLTEKTVFTRFRQWIGTPAYMSPEQAGLGNLDVDTRSDVYSLGVLLYELLTGQTPFDAQKMLASGYDAVLQTIREDDPPKPSTRLSTLAKEEMSAVATRRGTEPARLNRLVRGDLDWIVMKGLEKDRTRRYETASALAQDLGHFLCEEPVSAAAPAVGYRLRKFARRNRLALSTVGLFVLLVLAGASVSTWEAVQATRFAREAAKQEKLAIAEAARATQLATESETARRRADQEAAIAAAVNAFLNQDLLARAVPRAEAEEKPEPELKVRTLLDRASEKIGGRFTNQPLVEASLRATIASAYHDLGLYATQEIHARCAAELYARELGETNAAALRMLAAWGDAERHLGRTSEAVRRLEHVRDIQERVLGPAHTNTLRTLNLLGVAYSGADQGDRGRALLQEALRKAEESPVRKGPVVCELLNNLGILLAQDGQLAAAEETQRRHLALTRERVGTPNLETLGSLFHLATVLTFEKKFTEAETLFREAIGLSDQLGRSKVEDGTLLENLGVVLAGQKKLSEAEAVYREALALKRERRGPESAGVVEALARLAGVLNDGGRYAEAEPLLYEAIEILKRQPAIQDAEPFKACVTLVLVLDAQGKHTELESAMRDIQGLLKQRPDTASGVLMAKFFLAGALGKQGRLAEAEALMLGNWQATEWMVLEEMQVSQFITPKPPTAEQAMQKLTRLIDAGSAPNQEYALLARAAIHGRLGRSKEAAHDLARCFADDQTLLCLPLVPLWMDSGSVSGYERYRQGLWDHYNRSSGHLKGPLKYIPGKGWQMSQLEGDPATGAGVALALAIYPKAQSYKDTDSLAERVVERGGNHASLPRFQMVLGLVEYRFGRFESAAEWARRSLAGTNVEPATAAMANAVLAMARQRLDQREEAAGALQKAQGLLRTNLPPINESTRDLGENWPDWLAAELLVKEAAAADGAARAAQSSEVATNRPIMTLDYNSPSQTINFGAAFEPTKDPAGTEALPREETAGKRELSPLRPSTDQVYFPASLVAVVNERVLLGSDVRKKVSPGEQERLRRQYPNDQALFERKLKEQQQDALEKLINDELILAEATNAGRQVTKEHLDDFIQNQIRSRYYGDSNVFLLVLRAEGMTVEQFREQHRRDDLVAASRREKMASIPSPTPQQIEQYYHSHEKDFQVDESVKLSLITIEKKATNEVALGDSQRKLAAEIRARVVEGEDFAKVARLYSQDRFASQGGDWGWLERKALRKELADAAFSLKPGGLSEIIETEQAWYLIRVADRRSGAVKGMADVAADILQTVQMQERSAVMHEWMGKLRTRTFIRYFDGESGVAQSPEKVVSIEIKHIGVSTVGDAAIRSHLRVREGELVAQASVDHDIRSLYGTGDFYMIRVAAQTVTGGINLIYFVQERPMLTGIQFTGNTNISSSDLLQNLTSKTGERMDERKLFNDSQKIQDLYQRSGYPHATVRYVLNINEQGSCGSVKFAVIEGPQ